MQNYYFKGNVTIELQKHAFPNDPKAVRPC